MISKSLPRNISCPLVALLVHYAYASFQKDVTPVWGKERRYRVLGYAVTNPTYAAVHDRIPLTRSWF